MAEEARTPQTPEQVREARILSNIFMMSTVHMLNGYMCFKLPTEPHPVLFLPCDEDFSKVYGAKLKSPVKEFRETWKEHLVPHTLPDGCRGHYVRYEKLAADHVDKNPELMEAIEKAQ
jgi:hypothetical protein